MAFHYRVEIRNTSAELVGVLQHEINSIAWRYDTLGGCGEAEITLNRQFDNYGDIDLDYDVQLWRVEDVWGAPGVTPLPALLPIELGSAFTSALELRWSGFVREIAPTLEEVETVVLRCSGYVRQAEYLIVPAQTYANQDVGAIARAIVDTYLIPGSLIQRTPGLNLMQDTGISVSATGLSFDTSAFEAIRTLAEIGGNAEWGVRADREFYFLPRETAVKQTWVVGDRVKFYQARRSSDEVVNWVYLRGANDFTATLQRSGYLPDYQKERVVLVPSIADAADATLWGLSYFARFGQAQPKGTLRVGATDAWIENTGTMPPLGRLRVFGGQQMITQGTPLPGELPMELAEIYGGATDTKYRVESVFYRPTENGLDIEINLGERRGALTDLFRAIEFKLAELRQVV